MKIIVASKNPVKINAVHQGFQQIFPDATITVEGVSVPSGVSDQPMSDAETLQGATQRAQNASDAFPKADHWVGIEGGIETTSAHMMAFAWVVVQSRDHSGQARTGAFCLPPRVAQLIHEGKELGEADDIVFGHSNSKQKGGAVGLLTNNVIDRTGLYIPAVIMALIPFKHQKIYFDQ